MKAGTEQLRHYLCENLEIKVGNNSTAIMTAESVTSEKISIGAVLGNSAYMPIMHPLENLVKEIEFEGKKIRPMFELLKLASKQETIPSETIEYSINEKAYFIRVNYRGFYVILAYDDEDKSFRMIRNDKIVSVANQLEMFEMLFKWHFNVYSVESINK